MRLPRHHHSKPVFVQFVVPVLGLFLALVSLCWCLQQLEPVLNFATCGWRGGACWRRTPHKQGHWIPQLHALGHSTRKRKARPLRASGGTDELSNDGSSEDGEADWRAFRARLVQLEQSITPESDDGGKSTETSKTEDGWAYETPLIEQGAILLSTPSNHFAINQQYFHKNIILIVNHEPGFTTGIILNRPTALSLKDVKDVALSEDVSRELQSWNVWFGGDCEGINERGTNSQRSFVLHSLEDLADMSVKVIRGVYLIELEKARLLVAEGKADKDDFLLLIGYCGWGPDQLQGELDRGDTWNLVACDQRKVLGDLRSEQTALRNRLNEASKGQSFSAKDVGDGLAMWERLYETIGPNFKTRLADFKSSGDSAHTDEMLQRWINRCLIPERYRPDPDALPAADVAEMARIAQQRTSRESIIREGTILRGSATMWLLGKPVEHEMFDTWQFVPGQYFHKSVLVVVRVGDWSNNSPSLLALLNGPIIDSEESILWGGPANTGEVEIKSSTDSIRISGLCVLTPGTLEFLVELGAFEVASDNDLDKLIREPVVERWQAAGGRIDTLSDANTATLGDIQRTLWFRRFLDIEVP